VRRDQSRIAIFGILTLLGEFEIHFHPLVKVTVGNMAKRITLGLAMTLKIARTGECRNGEKFCATRRFWNWPMIPVCGCPKKNLRLG
jgi:hypothetical protein